MVVKVTQVQRRVHKIMVKARIIITCERSRIKKVPRLPACRQARPADREGSKTSSLNCTGAISIPKLHYAIPQPKRVLEANKDLYHQKIILSLSTQ